MPRHARALYARQVSTSDGIIHEVVEVELEHVNGSVVGSDRYERVGCMGEHLAFGDLADPAKRRLLEVEALEIALAQCTRDAREYRERAEANELAVRRLREQIQSIQRGAPQPGEPD